MQQTKPRKSVMVRSGNFTACYEDMSQMAMVLLIQLEEIKWADEVTTALEEMVDSIEKMSIQHGQALGTAEVTAWKMHVDDGESRFRDFASKLMAKTVSQPQSHNENSGSVPVNASIPQPGTVSFDSAAANAIKAAKADIEVDADIISNKSKNLAEDINKV